MPPFFKKGFLAPAPYPPGWIWMKKGLQHHTITFSVGLKKILSPSQSWKKEFCNPLPPSLTPLIPLICWCFERNKLIFDFWPPSPPHRRSSTRFWKNEFCPLFPAHRLYSLKWYISQSSSFSFLQNLPLAPLPPPSSVSSYVNNSLDFLLKKCSAQSISIKINFGQMKLHICSIKASQSSSFWTGSEWCLFFVKM